MITLVQIVVSLSETSAPPGRVLARIAERQHGVLSRAQLITLGFDDHWIGRAVINGRLHRVHAGVYAVGHPRLTQRGRWMAAVLAGGEGALLSHFSAGLLWKILDRDVDLIHVLVAGACAHRRPGLAMHRTRDLHSEHRHEIDGIPVTSLHRTLLDLAAVMPAERLRFAVEGADRLPRKDRLDVPSLVRLCDATTGRPGPGTLRRIALEQRGPIHRTKSPPERTFLRRWMRRGLPEPEVNVWLNGYEVDLLWRQEHLIVEVDSYGFHRKWPQIQRDRRRDANQKVGGYDTLRYTEDRVIEEEDVVFGQVLTMLGRARERAA